MYYFDTLDEGVNVRDSEYQPVVIEWDDGLITVTIAGVQICSFSPTPFDGAENLTNGYFGFSGSTGAGTDWQSIRNAYVYIDVVQLNVSNTSITECDANGDGFAQFDLTIEEVTLINNPENYDIEYYASMLDLGNGIQIPDPEHYVNDTPSGQTVYVIIRNSEDCFEVAEIELIVNSMPEQEEISTQYYCDDDGDGEIIVNLADYQSQFIIGDTTGLTFHFYADSALTIEIPSTDWANYTIDTFPHSVWIRAENTFPDLNVCFTGSEEIEFDLGENLPTNADVFQLSDEVFCVNVDEPAILDLTLIQPDFTDELDVDYFYYETEMQAQIGGNDFIPDPANYNVSASGSVYVRLEKTGFCISIIRIDFEIAFNPEALNYLELEPKCDDDFDGFVQFDLETEAIPQLVSDQTGLSFTYYLSESNAQNHINPQSSLVNLPTGDTISYWVVTSNGVCEVISEVQMTASEGLDGLEESVDAIEICDDDFDGIYMVDLTQVEGEFLSDTNGITFSYFTDMDLNNQIPASEVDGYIINSDTHIWIVIFNGDCSATREFDIIIKDEVPHNAPPFTLPGICESAGINLMEIESFITYQTGVDFTYFESESNAQNNINPIGNPGAYDPEESSGTLYVRLDLEDYCPVILPFEYEIYPLPINPFGDLPTLCSGQELILDAGEDYPDENYVWTWGSQQHIGSEITITEPGTYILSITTENNCEREFTLEIETPAQPVITNIIIGEDYLIIEAEGGGGLLEYSLNGVFWQDSPRFDNLIKDKEYTVYVREDGCDPVTDKAFIIFIPNFISPNGDGYNDTWSIRGLEYLQESNVKIFDRYGKIFVDSKPQDLVVWNGYYLGRPVPTGDYWYIITTVDQNLVSMKYVGHISVRNRD